MLQAQDYACAMCGAPFGDDVPQIDHDHACHAEEKRACEHCRRGLLCLRCNTALGYIERYREMADVYLARVPETRAAQWAALMELASKTD